MSMDIIQRLAWIILTITVLITIALFGQLASLRKTPIGYTHRFLRYTLPNFLTRFDRLLFNSSLTPPVAHTFTRLFTQKHPLILVFYLTLITIGIYFFINIAWAQLNPGEFVAISLIAPLPYITLHLAAHTDPGIITPHNHQSAITMYPYDFINFSPTAPHCRTCRLPKPARSKHCSVCNACIARHDHHCVWINNCVGVANMRYFLSFLFATDLVLGVGAWLCVRVLSRTVDVGGVPGQWLIIRAFSRGIPDQVYIAAIWLLCILCGVLSASFTAYHVYLIWAGTTTNETSKWANWKDEISIGSLYRAIPRSTPPVSPQDHTEPYSKLLTRRQKQQTCHLWPRQPVQWLYRVPPSNPNPNNNSNPNPNNDNEDEYCLPKGSDWIQVKSLVEIDNIYDVGWWANLLDVVFPRSLS